MREREKSVKASGLIVGFRFRLFCSADLYARASPRNDIQNALLNMPFVSFCSSWDKARSSFHLHRTRRIFSCGGALLQPCWWVGNTQATGNLGGLVWRV
jgi:hypothetical protein